MDLVPFLRSLVAIDSTSSRSNLPVLDRLEDAARGVGFETRRVTWVDEDGVDKGNLICRRGPDAPGGLALVGHTDCVPFDPEWTEALAGAERDGKVYGRGAADTKGFLAAALVAASRAVARRHPLALLFTADEEVGCLGSKRLLAEGRVHPRHAIVGEPTSLVPVRAHKGYCAVEVIIEAVGAELRREADAAFSPPHTTWNVGVVRGGKARNIIAGECRFTYEWRPLPGQDPRRALRLLEEACERLEASGGGRLSVEISPLRTDPAAVTPPEADVVRFLEAES